MASKRRASLLRRDFVSLLFSDEPLTVSVCVPVYNDLERDPTCVSRIITDEDLLLKLLSDFNRHASRLAQFFGIVNRNAVNRAKGGQRRRSWVGPGLADEFIENVVFPLLGDNFRQFQLETPFLDLIAGIIDFCLPYHPRPLEALAKHFGENETFLEALVSGETTSRVMKEWINLFPTTIFDNQILGSWMRKLITQCQRCESNHNVSNEMEIWQKLEDTIPCLVNLLHNDQSHKKPLSTPGIARKQSDSQQNLGSYTGVPRAVFDIPAEVNDILQFFQISPPNSERALQNSLDKLEKQETLNLLKAITASFPCRPCHEVCKNPSERQYDRFDTDTWQAMGLMLFTELIGKGIGIWRVLVSAQALKDMEQARIEGYLAMVEKKLVELASGEWEKNDLCHRAGVGTRSMLYLAPYGRGEGILWQIDVEFDEKAETTMQLIKVWRIGDIKMILQAIQHIVFIHQTYPPSRLDACKQRSMDETTGVNWPAPFGGIFNETLPALELDLHSQQKLAESLFQFNKFYMVTETTLSNLRIGNTDAEYPLVLSEEELTIIKDSTSSTLILGRSGTGKTTCLVYKLFGRYLISGHFGSTKIRRQALLTRSSILSNKLEVYTKHLIAAHTTNSNMTADPSVDTLHFIQEDDREVINTVFTMKDEDFPLVCTFNYFMKLLENTARAANRKDFSLGGTHNRSGTTQKWDPAMGSKRTWQRLFRRPQVVDFEIFNDQYWPSFASNMTKNVSSTLAFMEIIGVIKGSASFSADFSPLTRAEYYTKGPKISPVFVDRSLVYDLYERYEKLKRQFGDVDDIDRTRSVLEAISSDQDLRKRIERAFDEIYVDEIQDQRMLEVKLLIHLVKSPNAIHFAGDTAQSISKDSVFRFQSVKDLLFEQFSSSADATRTPQLRKLHQNYRTHQGILSVATTVMRLLYKCFPTMVDRMADEVGQFSGPKPTLFIGFDATIFSSRMFGATDLHDNVAQFGAEQVIIVRDIAHKEKLMKEIGDFALILTILESKGMEFEDVLLYDFFATSDCISAFRTMQSAVFDSNRHIALCSELKQLYVAITRAQSRLWFFESKAANVAPMIDIWTVNEPIVEVAHTNDRDIRQKLMQLRPGANAGSAIWSAKGYDFVHKKDYGNALFCFGRAKDTKGISLANAFIAEKKGKALLASGDEDGSEQYFRTAIDLFHECGHPLREAACYETLGMFQEAADIFSQNREYGRAADLYNKLNCFEKAAENYSRAGRHNEGASTLARGNCFDNLVHYLNQYGSFLDSSYRQHYSRLCNLLLKRGKISPELKDLTIAALQSDSEKEEFFKEYEMISHLSLFYTERGRFSEACSLAIEKGDLDSAWEVDEKYGGMSQLQQETRLEVYNYAQAKHLLDSLAYGPITVFLPSSSWSTECNWLSDVPSVPAFWGNLQKQLNAFSAHEISYQSLAFSETWMRQIFDIIVTLKSHAFIGSANTVTQLPMQSVNEVMRIAKAIIVSGVIPKPILILLRLIPVNRQPGYYIVMKSSPLLSELDFSTPSDAQSVVRAITRWIVTQISTTADRLHEKALTLYSRADPCLALLYQGSCRRPPGQCQFYHGLMTSSKYSELINDVLHVNTLFCNMLPLYHLRFGGLATEDVSKEFRPRQRAWLERLLARITYVSSLEHAPEILVRVRRSIVQGEGLYFGVFGGLEHLLFYRLKYNKDWESMCDFSSMLEQIQVAETLDVLQSFQRSLGYKVRWAHSMLSRISLRSLQDIENSLKWSSVLSSVMTLNNIVQSIRCGELQSYHAIATLYESRATFLIYMSNPVDFFLPVGWVEMYLRQMPQVVALLENDPSPSQKMVHREALLMLIQGFCGVVKTLNNDIGLNHKLSGRERAKGQGLAIFVRRNIDFLVTCTLNAFSWRTSQGGQGEDNIDLHLKYSQTRALVQQVLGLTFANAPELRACSSDYSLARKYSQSFESYAGKESPRIIKATSKIGSFFAFLEPIVLTITLSSLQASMRSETLNTRSGDGLSVEKEVKNETESVLKAAQTIQRMWRLRYRLLQNRREFFSSPHGQAIQYIQNVCLTVLSKELLDRRERVWRRGVLFSDCLEVHLRSEVVRQLYRESKDDVKTRIDSAETSHMEVFQVQWESLSKMQERVLESTSFLATRNLHKLQVPALQLSAMCIEALTALRGIESDLHRIHTSEREVVAAKAIQNMWRTRYPIVRSRREFCKTPFGQAISYIQRIYKSILCEAPMDRKNKIQRAGVLFTKVLEVYQYTKIIEKIYTQVKNAVSSRIRDGNPGEGMRSRHQLRQMLKVRERVRTEASFLSERNWGELDIPAGELSHKCQATLSFLAAIEGALDDIMANKYFVGGVLGK